MRLLIIFDCVEDVDITVVSAQSGAGPQFSTLQVGVWGPHGFTLSCVACTISSNQQDEAYIIGETVSGLLAPDSDCGIRHQSSH